MKKRYRYPAHIQYVDAVTWADFRREWPGPLLAAWDGVGHGTQQPEPEWGDPHGTVGYWVSFADPDSEWTGEGWQYGAVTALLLSERYWDEDFERYRDNEDTLSFMIPIDE